MKELPQRKRLRLQDFDYSQNGVYYVTIVTEGRQLLFGEIRNGAMHLNEFGYEVEKRFFNIAKKGIVIDKYIIMPNHIHAIFFFEYEDEDIKISLSKLIKEFKTITTKEYIDGVKSEKYPPFEKKIWQKSFHDKILTTEEKYLHAWQYIDENPLKWELDKEFKEM
ncbi:MAG: transposase [Clostridia bacterium]